MVICLEQDADLHIAHRIPLPLTVSCFSKIKIGFTFLVPAHAGSPGQRAIKRVCVCVSSSVHASVVVVHLSASTTDVTPTVGYSNVNFLFDGFDVTMYDLGGGSKIRDIWHNYYADVYGFVFVVDASDETRMEECLRVIEVCLENDLVQGKPLLL